MSRFPYPTPSREEILDVFRNTRGNLGVKDLAKILHVKRSEIEGLTQRLDAMTRDGQLKFTNTKGYAIQSSTGFITGQISAHPDGYGFLIPDEGTEDIFLAESEMQKVMHGDRVQVRKVTGDRRGRLEGTIVEVLTRAHTHVVGRLSYGKGVWLIIPEDRRIIHDILVSNPPTNAENGQIVNAELETQPTRYSPPLAKIVEVLGNMDDPGIEIEIAVRKFELPHVFSEAAERLAGKLPATVQNKDIKNRVDLRDIAFVTIDGEDARDFDDAVYCESVEFDSAQAYRLLVAIADVSHYVKPNDALDADALLRATSVYFPRRVIPMLPEKLSNNICSLMPQVDRLVLVCDMVISDSGEVRAYQFYPAVIHSAARLTYTTVAAILADAEGTEARQHAELVAHINNLYAVYGALARERKNRGAIDFETVETYIVSDAQGKIEQILPRVRNDAHRLIEECMLAANVCAADLLIRHEQPGTFRNHALPAREKISQLREFLGQQGLKLGGGASPQPADYAVLLRQVESRPDAPLLQTMLLRSMQQAVYSPDNVGHFGLAFKAYTHFTSPIRRYPDLLVHRAIKGILQGVRYEPVNIDRSLLNTNPTSAMRRPMNRNQADRNSSDSQKKSIWHDLGRHCSVNERRADEASRDVEAWLKCYFLKDRLGEQFDGTISGVVHFGVYVQLDDLFIEGLVHVSNLGPDYYEYNEVRNEWRGEYSGVRFRLTDSVTVQVVRVDLDSRQIDFTLVKGPLKPKKTHAGAPQAQFDRFKKRGIANEEESRNLSARPFEENGKDSKPASSRSEKSGAGEKKEENKKKKKKK